MRDSFVLLLRALGHQAVAVTSATEAVRYVTDGHDFDLLLTDYRLPDAYGTDVIRRIRGLRKLDVPVILVTGETMLSEIRDRAIPNCRVMSKPISIAALTRAIAQLTPDATVQSIMTSA